MTSENFNIPMTEEAQSLLSSALEQKLAMSIEQRIEAHENALQLCADIKAAGETLRAKSQSPS